MMVVLGIINANKSMKNFIKFFVMQGVSEILIKNPERFLFNL